MNPSPIKDDAIQREKKSRSWFHKRLSVMGIKEEYWDEILPKEDWLIEFTISYTTDTIHFKAVCHKSHKEYKAFVDSDFHPVYNVLHKTIVEDSAFAKALDIFRIGDVQDNRS